MSKIKLTKGELKKQRDSLKQFRHYLPTLLLKKQQLQIKILEIRREIDDRLTVLVQMEKGIVKWAGLLTGSARDPKVDAAQSGTILGSESFDLNPWVIPQEVVTGALNIAGANIPVLKDILFSEVNYDFYSTPFWVDKAIEELRGYMRKLVEVRVLNEQIERLAHELRITTQRVNLFEKIKIPECVENIRQIRIYLGDQQANAVGICKVAKRKIAEIPRNPATQSFR